MTERIKKIKHWLEEDLKASIKSFEPASSDASFRRYFRVELSACSNKRFDASYIVMDAPPEKEDIRPFIRIAHYFEQLKLHVPHIYEINLQEGFLLLSDLGNTPYLTVLTPDTAEQLYANAFDSLIKLQAADSGSLARQIELPTYSRQLLQNEMQLLEDWFINVHLQYSLGDAESIILHNTIEKLLDAVLRQPQVIVHRDFHSRNLMWVENNNPGIIDFQDAVIGPCSYDLVSLLNDSYIAWPETQIDVWINTFRQALVANQIIEDISPEVFSRWFTEMAMQRQIKVIGIFCRLYHRDGKANYLNDIPQTMKYLLRNSKKYEEYQAFYHLMQRLNQILETKS